MSQPDQPISKKILREFGLIMAAFIAVIFGLLIPWIWDNSISLIPWIISAVFALVALLVPMLLKPVFSIWMKFGAVMQKITNPIILGFVFFCLVTPFGWVRKLAKKDSLNRSLDTNANSYRVNASINRSNMRNPY